MVLSGGVTTSPHQSPSQIVLSKAGAGQRPHKSPSQKNRSVPPARANPPTKLYLLKPVRATSPHQPPAKYLTAGAGHQTGTNPPAKLYLALRGAAHVRPTLRVTFCQFVYDRDLQIPTAKAGRNRPSTNLTCSTQSKSTRSRSTKCDTATGSARTARPPPWLCTGLSGLGLALAKLKPALGLFCSGRPCLRARATPDKSCHTHRHGCMHINTRHNKYRSASSIQGKAGFCGSPETHPGAGPVGAVGGPFGSIWLFKFDGGRFADGGALEGRFVPLYPNRLRTCPPKTSGFPLYQISSPGSMPAVQCHQAGHARKWLHAASGHRGHQLVT